MSSALTQVMRNCWKINDPALPRLLRWKEARRRERVIWWNNEGDVRHRNEQCLYGRVSLLKSVWQCWHSTPLCFQVTCTRRHQQSTTLAPAWRGSASSRWVLWLLVTRSFVGGTSLCGINGSLCREQCLVSMCCWAPVTSVCVLLYFRFKGFFFLPSFEHHIENAV